MSVRILFDDPLRLQFFRNRIPLSVKDCVQLQKVGLANTLLKAPLKVYPRPHLDIQVACKSGNYLVTCSLGLRTDGPDEGEFVQDLWVHDIVQVSER